MSPYDGRVFLEKFALTVQDIEDVEKRRAQLTRPLDWQPNNVDISEKEFDRRFPPVKVASKKKKVRRTK